MQQQEKKKFTSCVHIIIAGGSESDGSEGREGNLEEEDVEELPFLREICAIPDAGHHVMVIQPGQWLLLSLSLNDSVAEFCCENAEFR